MVLFGKKFTLNQKIETDNGNKVYIKINGNLKELAIDEEISGLNLHIRGTNNIVIARNPAKIAKRNVLWKRDASYRYDKN